MSHADGPVLRPYSVVEANRALVFIERVARDLVEQFDSLIESQTMLDTADKAGDGDAYARIREEIKTTFDKLLHYRQSLEDIGVELQDWAKGIVHFPFLADRREVQLCWMLGEEQVGYWHEVGQCLESRRKVAELTKPGKYISEKRTSDSSVTQPR